MKKKQEKQIAVQRAVMHTMESHLSRWQPVAELKRNYDLFIKNLKRIEDCQVQISTDPEPIRHELAASRTNLIEQLFPVTSVLGVYAVDRGDSKLQGLAKVKYTGLENADSRELKKYARRILKTTLELMEKEPREGKKQAAGHIKDYGLGEKHVEDMQRSLDQYLAKEEQMEETLRMIKKSRKKLSVSVRENNALLKKKIDRLTQLFRGTESTFYNDYVKARLAVDEADGAAVTDREPVASPAEPTDGQPAAAKKSTAGAKKSTAPAKKSTPGAS